MSIAELLFFVIAIAGVYFALGPLQRRLERVLLRLMGGSDRTPGQGPVYRFNAKKEDRYK